jgi:C1A family cysteine protease
MGAMSDGAKQVGEIFQRSIAGYGWRPDMPDHRDLCGVFKNLKRSIPGGIRPKRVDLTGGIGPCYDQGDLGSCTGNSIASLIEFEQRFNKLPVFTPSRLFIYYFERLIEGSIRSDAGAEIRDGIKVASKYGVPPETLWPYLVKKFKTKPNVASQNEARKHLILKYARVPQDRNSILNTLAANTPIVFGFTVYSAFESDTVEASGVLTMPKAGEKSMGGHAVAIFGYEDENTLIVRNSWGTDWGYRPANASSRGYFKMPIDYVLNPNLADDFWAISAVQ